MAIENRNLEVGTRLMANYKKQAHVCTVEAGEGGEGIAFVLADGKRFKSPSAAAVAITGVAQNGWRFWSLEGEAPAAKPEGEPKPAKARSGKGKKTLYKIPNGKIAEGKNRWFCVSCMKSFLVDDDAVPAACPEGHAMEDLNAEPVVS